MSDDRFDFTGQESNIYLLPDYESEPDMQHAINNFLGSNYEDIFVSELEAWNTDPALFPKISRALFNDWFSISSHTMIFDMVEKPLKRE